MLIECHMDMIFINPSKRNFGCLGVVEIFPQHECKENTQMSVILSAV